MKGTKRQRQRGVWEVRVYIGRDPLTGSVRQVSKTVHGGAKEADAVLRDLIEKHSSARSDGAKATFGQLLDGLNWKRIDAALMDLSHSELTIACEQAAKEIILSKSPRVTTDVLVAALDERHRSRAN